MIGICQLVIFKMVKWVTRKSNYLQIISTHKPINVRKFGTHENLRYQLMWKFLVIFCSNLDTLNKEAKNKHFIFSLTTVLVWIIK